LSDSNFINDGVLKKILLMRDSIHDIYSNLHEI